MKLIVFLLAMISFLANAQEEPTDTGSTIKLRIFNPKEVPLTLIIKPRQPTEGLFEERFYTLKPRDTTVILDLLSLEENHVPRDEYTLSIFGAPDYYQINEHYYWNCTRIVLESYECLHKIQEHIRIDPVVFDSLDYVNGKIQGGEIFESYFIEVLPEFEGGDLELYKAAPDSIGITADSVNVNIYVQLLIEIDGSVSNVEIVKTSDESYTERTKAYFLRQRFTPGMQKGVKVRCKHVLPVTFRAD